MTIKIAFLTHDWKEQINVNRLNRIMANMNETVQITEFPTHSDEYGYVVHNQSFAIQNVLTEKETEAFWNNLTSEIYGDTDEMEPEVMDCYDKGFYTFQNVEEFRRLMVR